MKPCTLQPQPQMFSIKELLTFFHKITRSKKIYFFLYLPKWNPALFSPSSENKGNPL